MPAVFDFGPSCGDPYRFAGPVDRFLDGAPLSLMPNVGGCLAAHTAISRETRFTVFHLLAASLHSACHTRT